MDVLTSRDWPWMHLWRWEWKAGGVFIQQISPGVLQPMSLVRDNFIRPHGIIKWFELKRTLKILQSPVMGRADTHQIQLNTKTESKAHLSFQILEIFVPKHWFWNYFYKFRHKSLIVASKSEQPDKFSNTSLPCWWCFPLLLCILETGSQGWWGFHWLF